MVAVEQVNDHAPNIPNRAFAHLRILRIEAVKMECIEMATGTSPPCREVTVERVVVAI